MNLIIDQGNTYCKAAIFDQDEMLDLIKVENSQLNSLESAISKYSIDKAIISSVSTLSSLENLLSSMGIPAMTLSHKSILPIKIQYDTPHTLGLDRIAAAVGAWKQSPNSNNLIIDIGTCITYDMTTAEDGFIGGNIAPGLDMRLKAMHRQTQKLPLLERKESHNFLGKNTNEAIRNGAEYGIIAEINTYIETAITEYGEINTFLTGGDATYFEKKIKNSIFVVPNLLILGLFEILKTN